MRKSIWTVLLTALVALVAVGCAKEADLSDLKNKVTDLDKRVTALEDAVAKINNVTIPGFESLVNAVQNKISIVSVVEGDGEYTINFSDGTSATIKNGQDGNDGEDGNDAVAPEVSITLGEDGIYYWTVNGQLLKDEAGNPLPVTAKGDKGDQGIQGDKGDKGDKGDDGITPLFGTSSEGKVIVSYDGGETWKPLGFSVIDGSAFTSAYIDDNKSTEDYIVLVVGETEVQIPKEKTFSLKITYDGNLNSVGINAGETIALEYAVQGVSSTDEVTVDILSATAGITAKIAAVDAVSGYILIGVPAADPEATEPAKIEGKVFVFADNNKGKSNIKVISLEKGEIAAVADVSAQAPSTGGEFDLTVTTNKEYDANVNDEAASWLSVVATKATHTDKLKIVVAKNETGAYRVGTVTINDRNTADKIEEFNIVQQPSPEVTTDLASIRTLENGTEVAANGAIVLAASKAGALVADENGGYIYLALGLNVAVERGDVVNFTGVKKTNADTRAVYVDCTAGVVEDDEYEGEIPDLAVRPMRYHYSYGSINSGVSGLLKKTDAGYVVDVANYSEYFPTIAVEAPLGIDLEPMVGKYVTLKGYTVGSYVDYDDNSAFTEDSYVDFIANSAVELTFVENPNWTLTYEGTGDEGEVFKNTVAAGSEDYYYNYSAIVCPAKAIEEVGSIEELLVSEALYCADKVQYWFYYYKESIDDDATTKTSTMGYDMLDFGEYVAFVVGLNEDGYASGKYAKLEFEKVDPAVPLTYADFVGEWSINGVEVTVKPNVEGASYTIENYPNSASTRSGVHTLVANYNSEKGILEIPDQVIGDLEDPSTNHYGPLREYFCGYYASGYNYAYSLNEANFGVAAAFYGMPDGTLEIRGGANGDNTIKYAGYTFRWIIMTGNNAGKGNNYGNPTATPITGVTKVVKIAGTYDDFIGKWQVGASTWVIEEKVKGSTYKVTGIAGLNGELRGKATEVEGSFDAETGSFYIMEQKLDGQDFEVGQYGLCDNYMCGVFTSGGRNWGAYPTNTDTATKIFTGYFDEEGKVNLFPGTCSYGVFIGIGYEWVIRSGEDAGAGNTDAASSLTALPAVMEKAEEATADYLKWVGYWNIPAKVYQYDSETEEYIGETDGSSIFEIAALMPNKSYAITGIGPDGENQYAAVANYDKATGNLVVTPQVYEVWSYGSMSITESLGGLYGDSMITWSSNYTLFTATLENGKATLTPGAAPEGNFIGFESYQSYSGGGYAYGGYYVLPNEMTKTDAPAVSVKPAKKSVFAKSRFDAIASKPADPASWTIGKAEVVNVKAVAGKKK